MFMFQVTDAVKVVDSVLKSRICPKKVLPYASEEFGNYYDPACIKGMYECQNICGEKCKQECKDLEHPQGCGRGKLPENFLYCPSRTESPGTLEYVSYGLVEDKMIKEGKKPYKKMEKIREDKSFQEFIIQFTKDFEIYAKHKLKAWFLNNLKSFASHPEHQKAHNLICVSDFAQNLKLSKKQEISEEYFHKTQIAIFGSVSTIGGLTQHTMSQITSSDMK